MTEITAEIDRRETIARDLKLVGLVSAAHGMSHFYQLVLPVLAPVAAVGASLGGRSSP